ncbi:MAG: serine/threonine-protein kinase [Anaerolineales bacterium]|nr:serine/threonine-protein kinase [Anaerolineales bacterium]
MSLAEGSLIKDRYRIQSRLATGGMGAVYVALDETIQLQVAVKENLSLHEESARQFMREANLLATLRHPNLPRVTDHFIIENCQYLVMDFIEGDDLDHLMAKQPPTVEQILHWADGIADALIYLHSRPSPVIHRDIKPANIKIRSDGSPVLVDFGIAKEFDPTSKTTTGARGLTPGFSPPEQYGTGRTDARSDQYALAATLFSLLTLKKPPDSMDRLLKKLALPSPRTINPTVPEHVSNAVMKAMNLEADQRFEDMAQFRAALRGEFAVPTVLASDGSPYSPTVVSASRQAAAAKKAFPVALLALGLIGAAVVVIGAFILLPRIINPPAAPTEEIQAAAVTLETQPPESVATATATETLEPTQTQTPTQTLTPTLEPVVLGGSRMLAFVSDREDSHTLQVYTMFPDGSSIQQITFGPGQKRQPKFSPDGNYIAFVSNHEGNEEIYVMPVTGGTPINITNSEFNETDPEWSPDGSKIAFTSDRQYDVRQVFVMSISCTPDGCETGDPDNISHGFAIEFSPTWAPLDFESPNWLPAGYNIAVSTSILNTAAQIYMRSLGEQKSIDMDLQQYIRGAEQLDWSPSGEFIAFAWYQDNNEIYLARLSDRGYSPIRLTFSLGNFSPDFSPDSQYIAFSTTRDQNHEIYLMTINGANQINLTRNAARDMDPDWFPLP